MTAQIKPLFMEVDGLTQMTPTAMLIYSTQSAYGDPADMSLDAQRNRVFIRELLVAARDGGFLQTDITETILAQQPPSRRAYELAQAACDCVSPDAMHGVFLRVSEALGALD